MNNLFAQRLTELLAIHNLSKRALAHQLGVSAMSVSDWSTGKVQPTAENIYLVAQFFGVSSDYLLGLEDELGAKTF